MDSKPPNYRDFEGFALSKQNTRVIVKRWRNHESRLSSTLKLIQSAIDQYGIGDFNWILVCTGDRDDFSYVKKRGLDIIEDDEGRTFPALFFATTSDNFTNLCPDFTFDSWPETGIDSYSKTKQKFSRFDFPTAVTNAVVWRGANTHSSRTRLCDFDDKVRFDFEIITWDHKNPTRLTAPNFISLDDQVLRYRFLIDVQGNGYSGRLKLLLGGPRLVFVQQRIPRDFLFESIKPWKHFVPIRENFSDLIDNYNTVVQNPVLEESIIHSARSHSAKNLTPEAAIWRWAKLLNQFTTAGRIQQSRSLSNA
jgi:hypothetical protein